MPSPLFHCRGDESLYATFVTGGIYATFKRVDILAMYERIERERLSWTLLLPGVITDFMNNPRQQATISRASASLSAMPI